MKPMIGCVVLAMVAAGPGMADDFELRITGGSVQLGGQLVVAVKDADKAVPANATCDVDLPAPYASHVEVVSNACSALTLQQGFEPIRDDAGHAIPSAQVPYSLVVRAEDGSEVGRIDGMYPYNNQFSDLRVLIRDVRNPVSPGETFEAVVLGAGEPIADSLRCRWNTYGPVTFEPTSENQCVGRVTALAPDGRDGDMHAEIVNMTDMHAVGYAIAKIVVE